MSQEPPSSQLTFYSAEENLNLSDIPGSPDGDFDASGDFEDDYEWREEAPEPQPFENPPQGSEWTSGYGPDTFLCYQDVIEQLNKFSGPRGYAVTLRSPKRPKKKPGEPDKPFKRVYVGCDRGGPRKKGFNEFQRRRATSSRNVDCTWAGVLHRTGEYTWVFHIHEPGDHPLDTHNHDPSTTQASHPRLRRTALAPLRRTFVDIPTQQQRATPRQILSALNKHDYELPVIRKDINNRRAQLKLQQLNGRSPMQALLFELEESNQFRYFYATDEQNRVTQVFWIHRETFDLLRMNFEVLIMDCTFKTNRFRMPLFNIVGNTLLNTTFYLAFVLTASRAAEAFEWVFEKLQEVYTELELAFPRTIVTDNERGLIAPIQEMFPESAHIFCIWHVNEDVKAWAREKLTAREEFNRDTPPEEVSTVVGIKLNEFLAYWKPVVNAPTATAYDGAWGILNTKYIENWPAVITYLENTWLTQHKEKFVRAWTNHALHFDNVATSRVEKSHDCIKGCMHTRKGHVKYVIETTAELARTQVKEYKSRADDMKGKRLISLQFLPLFQLCHNRIANHALLRAYEMYQQVRNAPGPLPRCTGTYHGSLGVPCRHTMQRCMFANEPLNPAEFHLHWHFNRGAGPLPPMDDRYFVRDPAVLRSAVRQRIPGNRRIPSTHERRHAELDQRARNAAQAAETAQAARGGPRGGSGGRGSRGGRGRGGANVQAIPEGMLGQFRM